MGWNPYQSRNPFPVAFSQTAAAVVLLGAGMTGFDLGRKLHANHWTGAPVWWEIGLGLVCFVVAGVAWRRALRTVR